MLRKAVITVFVLVTIAASQYPSSVVRTYIRSCVNSGQTEEACACQIETFQENVSYSDFVILDTKIKMGNLNQYELEALKNIFNNCSGRAMQGLQQQNDYLERQNKYLDKQKELNDADCDRRLRNYRPPKY